MNIDTKEFGSKISEAIDWAIFIPVLLLLIPIIAVPSIIGWVFFGADGGEIASFMIEWVLRIGIVIITGLLTAALIFVPWIGGGWLFAILFGSWLTPLGLVILPMAWIPFVASMIFNVEIAPLNPKLFVIFGMIICFVTKIVRSFDGR